MSVKRAGMRPWERSAGSRARRMSLSEPPPSGCGAPRTAARAGPSTPRYMSTTGSTLTTGGSIYVVENGRRDRSADRPFARRHALGAHVVPSAGRSAEGRIPCDRLRPPWPRPVGARRGGTLDREPRQGREDGRRRTRPARRSARRALAGWCRRAVVRHRLPRDRGRTRRRHRLAVDARKHGIRLPLDAYEGRLEEAHQPRHPTRSGCGQPNLGFLAARVGFGKRPLRATSSSFGG